MSVHRLTPPEKVQRKRSQAAAKVRSCGLPFDHPALLYALMFLLGARSADTAMTYANGLFRWLRYCVLNGIEPFEEAGGQLDLAEPVSHVAWLIGRQLLT